MRRVALLPHRSIRTKLILVVAGTMVAGTVAVGLLVRNLVFDSILRNKLRTVEILTASLVHDAKYNMDGGRDIPYQELIAKYMTYYRIIHRLSFFDGQLVNVADSDSRFMGQSTADPEIVAAVSLAKPALHVTRSDWKNLGIRSVSPIMRGSRIVGAVVVDISMQDVQATIVSIDRRIGIIMLAELVLLSLISYVVLRGVLLVRLNRITVATRRIATGDYGVHIADDSRDELGVLAQAFNRMTGDLRNSKQELDNHNIRLEERVREATAQLQQAYEELKSAQSQLILNEKMASLGVLIAGLAHEINTPVGAVLNVSRNLEKKISTLPALLEHTQLDDPVLAPRMRCCLEEVIRAAHRPDHAGSYRDTRDLERVLADAGAADPRGLARSLTRLNLGDRAVATEYLDLLVQPSFFALVDSVGSIAQAARISEASSQKISEIVRALKYYSYSGTDKVDPVQVNDSIQTALVLLRSRLKDDITVHTDLATEMPPVAATSEIHQVWTNLIVNACDAIAARGDGVAGELRITTRMTGERVLITFRDNGCGIPPDKIHQIFDPFFTTKDIGKGTGLGLSIVSGIIKKHGGVIRVTSRPGDTIFEIQLPTSGVRGAGDAVEAGSGLESGTAEQPSMATTETGGVWHVS